MRGREGEGCLTLENKECGWLDPIPEEPPEAPGADGDPAALPGGWRRAPLCLSSPDSLQKNLAATGEQLRLEQLRMV